MCSCDDDRSHRLIDATPGWGIAPPERCHICDGPAAGDSSEPSGSSEACDPSLTATGATSSFGLPNSVSKTSVSLLTACLVKSPTSADSAATPYGLTFASG